MKKWLLYTLLLLAVVYACDQEEDYLLDSSAEISFSLDTIRFDTVFTEIGSATRFIKIYNNNDQPVLLNNVRLQNGANSAFRINVDGIPGIEVSEVEIGPNDSIYVFAEVTVNPDDPLSISPFVIEEFLEVELNGVNRQISLEAWGQNANYIPNRFNQGGGAFVSCDFQEVSFNDPKPYVIYGVLIVDSCTLNIPAGTDIFIHGGIVRTGILGENYNDGFIFVQPNGKLRVNGTAENPVTIQGDRLETAFEDVPGQWGGIYLARTSRGSRIEHAVIRNARFGVIADSASSLVLLNTTVANAISGGVIGIHSSITANNCLIYGNGGNAVQLEYGGLYDFRHCTLASYGVDNSALRLSNALCLDQLCTEARLNRLNAKFVNSIIFGSRRDEVEFFNLEEAAFEYSFENCVVKTEELIEDTPDFYDHCVPCIPEPGNTDILLFENVDEDNYRLDSLSIADGFAQPLSSIPLDIEGTLRDLSTPDVGCFEKID